MNQIKNQIALSQNLGLVITNGSSSNPKLVLALMAEISTLGFKFDKKLLQVLKTCSQKELKEIKSFLIPELSKMVGSHVRYTPLFKNFPEDVPNDHEYLFKRIIGFLDNYLELTDEASSNAQKLSCGCIVNSDLFDLELFGACPICQRQHDLDLKPSKRKKLSEKPVLKTIKLISENDFSILLTNLVNSKSSYSEKMKEDIEKAFNLYKKDIIQFVPKEWIIKENLAFVGSLMVKNPDLSLNTAWFKTATDVLRLAVALSKGDISLKEDSKFKLANRERKIILSLINSVSNPLEDMLRYRQKWLRLAEYLHVGAYQTKYPQAFNTLQVLRNNHYSIDTFNKQAHKAVLKTISSGDASGAVKILSLRPGEYARKLDLLLRESCDDQVLKTFEEVIDKVATPLLLKLNKNLTSRTEKASFRYFIPKGKMAKLFFLPEDNRKVLTSEQVTKAKKIINNELKKRFSKNNLTHVFIDPSLKGLIVPLALRNSSKALSTVERGSRIVLNSEAKAFRLFLYWKENSTSGRIDVDLSAAGYDKNWKYVTHLSWTSLKSLDCVHSGDIQSAPNGAAEFIDINRESLLNNNIRYVTMNVYSWTGQAFNTFESFAGIMERKSTKSGEIFEPKTVKNKFDLSGDSSVNMPLILDLVTGELIWSDFSLGKGSGRRVEANDKQIVWVGKSILDMQKNLPNLFELFSLHAKAQGAKIDTVKKDGVKYDLEINMEKAKDIADILANWI